jgi:hypothetical protein
LPSYDRTAVRRESHTLARRISEEVRACYHRYDYEPICVPAVSLADRVTFITERLTST